MLKNSTKADAEVIARATLRQTKKLRLILFGMAFLFILIGIVALYMDYKGEIDGKAGGLFGLTFALVIIIMTSLLSSKKFQVGNAQRIYRGNVKEYDFTFTAEGFELNYSENSIKGNVTGDYSAFLKVQEFKDMYLLFLNTRQLYIVLKSGMTEGSTEELSALFREKVFDRFKVCYKK